MQRNPRPPLVLVRAQLELGELTVCSETCQTSSLVRLAPLPEALVCGRAPGSAHPGRAKWPQPGV